MDGFEKRKEKKKESIRRAALDLFQTYGFRKVSVAEIARKAGVSQVTIYNHFGSREQLVEDVMKWFIEGLLQKYLDVMSADRPFADRLEEIVFDKSEIAGQFQGELLTTYAQNNPEMQRYIDKIAGEKVVPAVEEFFQEGIDQGYIDATFSRDAIMTYFEIIRRGFYGSADVIERVSSSPDLTREMIRLITYGLNG